MEDERQPTKSRKAPAVQTAALVFGVLVLGTAVWLSGRSGPNQSDRLPPGNESEKQTPEAATQHSARPRLLDLGATTCIPCKQMVPVLEALRSEYEGRLDVEFIDVWRVPGVAEQYGIEAIPTQIFFDASGKELYRHQGFFAKDEILRKWDELGVDLKK